MQPVNRKLHSHARPASCALTTLLEVVLLALLPLSLALADDALAEPLSLEALVELGEILNDVAAAMDDRLLGCDGAVGLDAELEGREEGVRHLVGGEHDGGVLEEALREQVAEGVVLLVERKDSRVGDACAQGLGLAGGIGGESWGVAHGSQPSPRPSSHPRLAERARTYCHSRLDQL
jgi:hypothetical protein